MELLIYSRTYAEADAMRNFIDFYYSLHMTHLASDLLAKGLSPKQISDAVLKATKIANALGVEVHKHFRPVFSGIRQDIIQDCKLSDLGFGLVLMNADTSLSVVGEFQMNVLKKYLDSRF
ncbi:hypothetical protein ESY86_05150 [Subsaximicrobium wynnwilliamsii]|uniref:Uncharacterized protein n=1 Tax=Subsaximicrobium wynnwilliamsii TaxID=291179 RepID=A0A5C6ZJK6_9FLAO|nr:hypothetical protein [Subsaximicrobium wynnwilliamsii]TXD84455.1 hypothetical protein ESY87_04930 [Subsaximicrobium wynnwilliamsii]TXD90136.1 hypothetical protein ESY86_05150 [Subsaximicrobium wynnwilliamsii]TXE04188.1 hypothetical protein ESY88_04925 [Subsaximicrobium wynnwilliamsii]